MKTDRDQSHFSFDILNTCIADSLKQFAIKNPLRKDICIIGAGIAGLVAGYELKKLGYRVTIYEASNRVGGRVLTHRFSDGTYAELGAMRIPAHHHSTLHYIKELNLKTRPFINYNGNAYFLVNSKRARLFEWQQIASSYRLRASESNKDPRLLLEEVMVEAFARIPTNEKYDIFSNIRSGIATEYDSLSMRQALVNSKELSEQAFDFIGATTGMHQYEHASFLEVLIDYFGLFRVDQYEIVGGMDLLPARLAYELEGSIKLSHRVNRILLNKEEGVSVWLAGRGTKQFDYVICATPAPATARIEFTPSLSSETLSALRGVHYASSAKTVIHVKKRVWEIDDKIAGGGSFTDELLQQCWYPSDNAAKGDDLMVAGFTGDEYEQNRYSYASRSWVPLDGEVSNSPATMTASYTWERNARRISSLNDSRQSEILKTLDRLHPGITREIDDIVHFSWDQQESPGGGAFAYFAPGEHARYMRAMQEPFPSQGPRLFFAGEHLSVAHAWIQGAIDTALKAVQQILQNNV